MPIFIGKNIVIPDSAQLIDPSQATVLPDLITPMQAIQAATINAADLIGNRKIGSLRPGNYADIIAVKADVLKDIKALEHIDFIMKGGEIYKN